MKRVVDRIQWHRKQWAHRRLAAGVLKARPIVPADDGVIYFSMIGTRVLLPYLVSIKSLWHQVPRGRVVILDDGTLTDADRKLLAYHLGDPEIRAIAAVDTGECPRGGTWERLLTILDLRADAYVIQVNSDTVTVGPLPEVAAAIDAGRSFTLKGEAASQILPLATIAAQAIEFAALHQPRGACAGGDRIGDGPARSARAGGAGLCARLFGVRGLRAERRGTANRRSLFARGDGAARRRTLGTMG